MAAYEHARVRGLFSGIPLASEETSQCVNDIYDWIAIVKGDAVPVDDKCGKRSATGRLRLQYGYNYTTRGTIVPADPMPEVLTRLAELVCQLATDAGARLPAGVPNQCLINFYAPGQGIAYHVDSRMFGNAILCVTMGGKRQMRFRYKLDPSRAEERLITDKDTLYVMTEAARYEWEHSMPALRSNEECFSVTFRWYKKIK